MSSANTFSVIRYTLELQAPVLATDIMGEPNSAVTLPYISGALLRGAWVARYLQNGGMAIDAGAENARQRFFGEQTRFLNAYPFNQQLTNKEKRRALPTPSVWRRDKQDYAGDGEGRKTYDFSRRSFDIRDEATDGAFFWRDERDAALFTTPRRLNVHTQRDARQGRSTKDSGDIYRYEALAAGTQLQALILTTPALAEEIAGWLKGATLWIGRARRAGYGKAVVVNVEQPDYWRESGADDSPAAVEIKGKPEKELHITFTSDALLRDENGQATLDPRPALEAALGIPLQEPLKSLPERSWAESKIVGGFNRKWKLPLPQTVALAAGSVFVYQTTATIGWEPLLELERLGLGERRNEGFGRVLVDWMKGKGDAFTSYEIRLSPAVESKPLTDKEREQAESIARRILCRQLDEILREKINRTRLEHAPHKSQLARLRAILRHLQDVDELDDDQADSRINEFRDYCDSLLARRSTKAQFHRAQVSSNGNKESLLSWLQDQLGLLEEEKLAEQEQPDEEKLEESRSRKAARKRVERWKSSAAVSLGQGTVVVNAEVDEKLALEYALRFVDQVLYRASKEQSTEERQ